MKRRSLFWGILGFFVKDPGVISAGLVRFLKLGALAGIATLMEQGFWEEGLTGVGLFLLMSGLGGLEKILKEKWGIGLALALAFTFAAAPAQAQAIQLEPKDFSVGGGSMLGEESMTFSWDAAFAAVHWHGVGLFDGNGTTGAGVEIHPASVVSVIEDGVQVSALETVDWRLWSLNRAKMSALQIPGEIWESMYLGTDFLIAEGGGFDFTDDFNARFVYGVREGPVQFELYMFEKYRPISFAFMYRF